VTNRPGTIVFLVPFMAPFLGNNIIIIILIIIILTFICLIKKSSEKEFSFKRISNVVYNNGDGPT